MPYDSQRQRGWFHTHVKQVGGEAVVKEFDEASEGKKLPEKKQTWDHELRQRGKGRM